jgi:hypothetical protein
MYGDSQTRVLFDLLTLRINGSHEGLDRNEKHHERQPAFFPYIPPPDLNVNNTRILPNPDSTQIETQKSPNKNDNKNNNGNSTKTNNTNTTQSKTTRNFLNAQNPAAQGASVHYYWNAYLERIFNYPIYEPLNQQKFPTDDHLKETDMILLNTGHWPAGGNFQGGFWTMKRYTAMVEYLMQNMKTIQMQRKFLGYKELKVVWVGILANGMFQNWEKYEAQQDQRGFIRMKMWSEASREIVLRNGFEFIDGYTFTAPWVQQSPDGTHFHTTPGLEALTDEVLHKFNICNN